MFNVVNTFKRIISGKKSRDYVVEVTPRQIIKASERDLRETESRLSHLPRELYFGVLKIDRGLNHAQKMELAERIDDLFLNLPKA